MAEHGNSYKLAGVDVNAGYEAVELMKEHIEKTRVPGMLSGLGGFGGLFMPNLGGMKEPVLVSGTDGVGTKLKLAFLMDKHNTIGNIVARSGIFDALHTEGVQRVELISPAADIVASKEQAPECIDTQIEFIIVNDTQ